VEDISQHYLSAPIRAEFGERTISIDEMTGIQALERALPSLPMRPGQVERREARIYSSWHPNLDCQL
jgi:putative transposase